MTRKKEEMISTLQMAWKEKEINDERRHEGDIRQSVFADWTTHTDWPSRRTRMTHRHGGWRNEHVTSPFISRRDRPTDTTQMKNSWRRSTHVLKQENHSTRKSCLVYMIHIWVHRPTKKIWCLHTLRLCCKQDTQTDREFNGKSWCLPYCQWRWSRVKTGWSTCRSLTLERIIFRASFRQAVYPTRLYTIQRQSGRRTQRDLTYRRHPWKNEREIGPFVSPRLPLELFPERFCSFPFENEASDSVWRSRERENSKFSSRPDFFPSSSRTPRNGRECFKVRVPSSQCLCVLFWERRKVLDSLSDEKTSLVSWKMEAI